MPSFKRKALCAFFLLLSSCASSPHWDYQAAITSCPAFNSGRMTLSEVDELCFVEVELDRGSSGIKMYLNVSSLPLWTESSTLPIEITINQEKQAGQGTILTGGQRVLLSEETKNIIVDALLNANEVDIQFSRYQAHIIPDQFAENYTKLLSIPI